MNTYIDSEKLSRNIPKYIKERVASKQFYKCNNKPGSNLYEIDDYLCPLWKRAEIEYRGSFDYSDYEIDHVIEFSFTSDNSEHNLQALCRYCYYVKTKNFMEENKKKKHKNNDEIIKKMLLDYSHMQDLSNNEEIEKTRLCTQERKIYSNSLHAENNNNDVLLFEILEKEPEDLNDFALDANIDEVNKYLQLPVNEIENYKEYFKDAYIL